MQLWVEWRWVDLEKCLAGGSEATWVCSRLWCPPSPTDHPPHLHRFFRSRKMHRFTQVARTRADAWSNTPHHECRLVVLRMRLLMCAHICKVKQLVQRYAIQVLLQPILRIEGVRRNLNLCLASFRLTPAIPGHSLLISGVGDRDSLFTEPACRPRPVGVCKKDNGIHDTSLHFVRKGDVDIRKGLCTNVVLSVGITQFQGIGVT